jgi:hypothetical protein
LGYNCATRATRMAQFTPPRYLRNPASQSMAGNKPRH